MGVSLFLAFLWLFARFFILCFFLYVFYEGKLITIQITVNRHENHTDKKTTESRMATCLFHLPSDTFNLKMQPKFLHVNLIFLLAPSIITKWKSCIKFGLPVITADKFLNLYADKISWYDCLKHNFKERFTTTGVITKLIEICCITFPKLRFRVCCIDCRSMQKGKSYILSEAFD